MAMRLCILTLFGLASSANHKVGPKAPNSGTLYVPRYVAFVAGALATLMGKLVLGEHGMLVACRSRNQKEMR